MSLACYTEGQETRVTLDGELGRDRLSVSSLCVARRRERKRWSLPRQATILKIMRTSLTFASCERDGFSRLRLFGLGNFETTQFRISLNDQFNTDLLLRLGMATLPKRPSRRLTGLPPAVVLCREHSDLMSHPCLERESSRPSRDAPACERQQSPIQTWPMGISLLLQTGLNDVPSTDDPALINATNLRFGSTRSNKSTTFFRFLEKQ